MGKLEIGYRSYIHISIEHKTLGFLKIYFNCEVFVNWRLMRESNKYQRFKNN